MAFLMNRRSFVRNAALSAAALAAIPSALALADEKEADSEPEADSASTEPDEDVTTLQIFADCSLAKALPEILELYTTANPDITFAEPQFYDSTDLVAQLADSTKADILIAVSEDVMDEAVEKDLVDKYTCNIMFNSSLVIAAAEDSKVEIEDLADICDDDIESIAIGDTGSVLSGMYANQALYSIGQYSEESGHDGEYESEIADKVNLCDDTSTCANDVSTGECTIGFMYATDVYCYDGIEAIFTVPDDVHDQIPYASVVCTDTEYADEVTAFLDFCMNDDDAIKIWAEYGFETVELEEDLGPNGEDEGDTDSDLKDGVYVGTGTGENGKFDVTVTIEGGKITAVEVGENEETDGIGSKAIESIPDQIVENNGLDGVSMYAGATITSRAIFTAVSAALAEAAA